MFQIPAMPRWYFSREDNEKPPNFSKISGSPEFQARVAYFERCAESMNVFLNIAELSDEKRRLYEGVVRVLNFCDSSVLDFARIHIGVVAEAVFEQHLLESDIAYAEYGDATELLKSIMNAQFEEGPSMFDVLVESHAEKEFSASVFFLTSDMIDIVNAHMSSRCVH